MKCKCCGEEMILYSFGGRLYWICEDCEIWENYL